MNTAGNGRKFVLDQKRADWVCSRDWIEEVAFEPSGEIEKRMVAAHCSDARVEKMMKVRTAIANGTYQVSAVDLAQKLVEKGSSTAGFGRWPWL